MTEEVTYKTTIRSFDHEAYVGVSSYPTLRLVISKFANEARGSLGEILVALRDMAVTASYGDLCTECTDGTLDERTAWPYRGELDGEHILCHYLCSRCGARWYCTWTADPSKLP